MDQYLNGQDKKPILNVRCDYLDMCHFTINVCCRLSMSILVLLMTGVSFPLAAGTGFRICFPSSDLMNFGYTGNNHLSLTTFSKLLD